MRFNVGFGTDVGRKRQQNQDNGAAVPELGLFLVADGMGGHNGGEIASQMAVDIIKKEVKERSPKSKSPQTLIKSALEQANSSIFDRAKRESELDGMGTTTTALLFQKNELTIAHVGDSRCYYLRGGAIWQLTRDHSLVEEKIRAGLITREEAKQDLMRNVITRSVGFEPSVNVDLYEMEVQEGDCFLICSDGLSGAVDDKQIMSITQSEIFEDNKGHFDEAVAKLIDAANESGGEDNITVLVVQVAGS